MTDDRSSRSARHQADAVNPDQLDRNLRLLDVAATREDRLTLLGQIGEAQLALGYYREAEATLREAVTLAGELVDRRMSCANLIQLASAIQHQNRNEEAAELYRAAIDSADEADGARDDLAGSALLHYGACLAELGRREEAIASLRRALTLRRAGGDRAQVAATEKALAALGAAG